MKQPELQSFFNKIEAGHIAWVQDFDASKIGDNAIQFGSWSDDKRRYPLIPNHCESVIKVVRDAANNVISIITVVADGNKVRYGNFIQEHSAALLIDEEKWVIGALKYLTDASRTIMINYWISLVGKDYDGKAIAIIAAHEIPLIGWLTGWVVDRFLQQEKDKYICSEDVEEGISEIGVQGGIVYNTKKDKGEIPTPKNLFVNLCNASQLTIVADSVLMAFFF